MNPSMDNRRGSLRQSFSMHALMAMQPEDPEVLVMRRKISEMRRRREEIAEQHEEDLYERQLKLEEATEAFEKAHEDFHRDFSIAQYTSAIKENNKLPGFVLVLQSKVLRNVHHLCVVDAQLRLMEEQSNQLVAHVKKSARTIAEEATEVEKELLNKLMCIQGEEVTIRDSYRDTLANQSMELEEFQSKLPKRKSMGESDSTAFTEGTEASGLDELVDHLSKLNERLSAQTTALERNESLNIGDMVSGKDTETKEAQRQPFAYGENLDVSLKGISQRLRSSFSHMLWSNNRNEMVSI